MTQTETMQDAPKVVLISGAGSGIGRATALKFLNEGCRVVLAGRRRDALEETVTLAGAAGENALVVPTDVSRDAEVDALFDAIKDTHGRLDVVFNNAGANAPGTPFVELTREKWRQVVDVNLTGVFMISQLAFRMMKEQDPQGGRIIMNGSISAHAPRPESAPYTATKHAITGLTKTLSLDGRAFNIAVGQIDIGNAVSPLTERMVSGAGVRQADGTMAVEPRMDVDHCADAVWHMAQLPLESNIQFMTIMATKMPFVGRG